MYVLNVVDGCIPSDIATGSAAEIEEERRLLYVAMTRAKHHLELVVPQRFYVTQQHGMGDRHVYAARTRFMPPAVVALSTAGAGHGGRDGGYSAAADGSIDLAAQVRKLF